MLYRYFRPTIEQLTYFIVSKNRDLVVNNSCGTTPDLKRVTRSSKNNTPSDKYPSSTNSSNTLRELEKALMATSSTDNSSSNSNSNCSINHNEKASNNTEKKRDNKAKNKKNYFENKLEKILANMSDEE